MMLRHARTVMLAGAVVAVAACAGLLVDDTREVAREDHAACTARGHQWPSTAYETCRYDLAERRHARDWRNLRMIEPRRPDQGPVPPADPYRPLPRAEFRCRERTDDAGSAWIECST